MTKILPPSKCRSVSLFWSALFIFATSAANTALACDPCALYSASQLQGHEAGVFTLGAYEQFTDFKKAKNLPENSFREGEIVKDYSSTQLLAAYDITEDFGVQANLPLIYRRYDEIKKFRTSSETDFGLGDASLLANYSVVAKRDPKWTLLVGLSGGIKLPTGDTGSIESSVSSIETAAATTTLETASLKHHQISGASGGRALTLGTGSVDYITGTSFFSRYEKFLLSGFAQYTIRTEGDFDYEFADDFIWSVGPGYYLSLGHEYSIAGRLALTGEHKSKDKLESETVNGSQFSNLYLGPQVLFTLGEKISGEVSLDFRVSDEDHDATVVPEYKVRTGISYRFS